jgi:hypothetical protein
MLGGANVASFGQHHKRMPFTFSPQFPGTVMGGSVRARVKIASP